MAADGRTRIPASILALVATQALLLIPALQPAAVVTFALAWRWRHRWEGEPLGRGPRATDGSEVLAWAAVAAVVALAAAFRLYRITTIPPGLYVDEAATARNALLWRFSEHKNWSAGTPLRHQGWVETPNLYLAYASLVMGLFGDGTVGVRMFSVIPSLLCVALVYLLSREYWGHRTSLLAAFLLAVSHWATRTGRTGWDQVMMTCLQLLALLLLHRGIARRRPWLSVAAGMALGLCQYTYVASRLVALQIALWGVAEVAARQSRRRAAMHVCLALGLALLVATPHLWYVFRHSPAGAGTRAAELAIHRGRSPAATLALLAHNVVRHATMFNGRGGLYARDNLPGAPMVDPLTGIMLLAGLIVVLGRRTPARRLLVTWYVVCVLGGVLSVSQEGAPYVYRTANLAPWACMVAAAGGMDLARRLMALRPTWATLRLPIAAATVLLLTGALNATVLFGLGPRCPDVPRVFGTAEATVGTWLKNHPDWRPCFVHTAALVPQRQDALHCLSFNRGNYYRPIDSATALQLTAGVYARDPRRALEPLAIRDDVNVVHELPVEVEPGTAIVVRPTATADLTQDFDVIEEERIVDRTGTVECVAARVRCRIPPTDRSVKNSMKAL